MPTEREERRSTEPTDEEIVETASEAAEGFVLSQYKQSRITDLDVTVRFTEGTLDVDVYLNAPAEPADPDPERVVEQAVEAATDAVDELFAASDSGASESGAGEPGAR
jgi:hypothetical protein